MIVPWGLCLLLMIATVGEGGAAPSSLLAQHAVVCAILVAVLVGPRGGSRRLDRSLSACLAAFAVLALAGALLAGYAYAAFLVTLELASFLAVLGLAARAGPWQLSLLGAAIGAAVLAQSIWAMTQRFAAGALRPAGGFLNPNHLAAWLTAALFLIWGVAWAHGRRIRLLAVAATLPALAVLFVVGSRGAVLGLAAGGVAAFACAAQAQDRRRLRGLAMAALLLLAIGAAGVALRFRVADPFGAARPAIWRACAQVLVEHPWFGTKPGQFETEAANLNFSREGDALRFDRSFSTPHSDVLRAPVEFGVPAALALAAALFVILRRVVRRVRLGHVTSGETGAIAALAALAAQATVNDLTETPAIYLLGAALLGSLLAVEAGVAGEPRGASDRALGWSAAALLVVGLVVAELAPYRAWTIQTALPRGALTPSQRHALDRARRLNPYQPDLAIRVTDDLVSRSATWTVDDYVTARAAAEEAVRLAPAASAGWRALARVEGSGCRVLFHDLATRARAGAAYLEAESHARHDPFLPLEAGHFLLSTGDLDGARRAAVRTLRIEPNAIPPRLLLAELSLAEGGDAGRTEARERLDEAEALAIRFATLPKESPYAMRLLTADPDSVRRLRARVAQEATQPPLDGRSTGD